MNGLIHLLQTSYRHLRLCRCLHNTHLPLQDLRRSLIVLGCSTLYAAALEASRDCAGGTNDGMVGRAVRNFLCATGAAESGEKALEYAAELAARLPTGLVTTSCEHITGMVLGTKGRGKREVAGAQGRAAQDVRARDGGSAAAQAFRALQSFSIRRVHHRVT